MEKGCIKIPFFIDMLCKSCAAHGTPDQTAGARSPFWEEDARKRHARLQEQVTMPVAQQSASAATAASPLGGWNSSQWEVAGCQGTEVVDLHSTAGLAHVFSSPSNTQLQLYSYQGPSDQQDNSNSEDSQELDMLKRGQGSPFGGVKQMSKDKLLAQAMKMNSKMSGDDMKNDNARKVWEHSERHGNGQARGPAPCIGFDAHQATRNLVSTQANAQQNQQSSATKAKQVAPVEKALQSPEQLRATQQAAAADAGWI